MSDISKAVGENSPELIEALKNAASVAEMQEIRRTFLVGQGAERDRFSPDKLIFGDNFKSPDEATGGTVSRVVKIRGVDQKFSAGSLLELEKEINAALIAAGGTGGGDADAGTQRSTVQSRHPLTGQFQDASNPAVQAEMTELLRTGRITPQEFVLAMPQTLDEVMKTRFNLDPQQIESERFTNSWAAATKEFLESEAGKDWPGGEANKETLGRILQENDLTDSPSAETLARAYAHLKIHALLVANPETEAQKSISEALSVEDIRAAAYRAQGLEPPTSRGGGGFWRR